MYSSHPMKSSIRSTLYDHDNTILNTIQNDERTTGSESKDTPQSDSFGRSIHSAGLGDDGENN